MSEERQYRPEEGIRWFATGSRSLCEPLGASPHGRFHWPDSINPRARGGWRKVRRQSLRHPAGPGSADSFFELKARSFPVADLPDRLSRSDWILPTIGY